MRTKLPLTSLHIKCWENCLKTSFWFCISHTLLNSLQTSRSGLHRTYFYSHWTFACIFRSHSAGWWTAGAIPTRGQLVMEATVIHINVAQRMSYTLRLLFPSALNTFHRYPHVTYTLTSFSFPLRCQFFTILYKIALLGSANSLSPVNYQAQTQGLLESSIYKGACQFHQLFLSLN